MTLCTEPRSSLKNNHRSLSITSGNYAQACADLIKSTIGSDGRTGAYAACPRATAPDRTGRAGPMASACITAISGKYSIPRGLRPGYIGEDILIHKNYVEFKPYEPDMNVSRKKFDGFTPAEEKTPDQIDKAHEIHYNFLKNQYDFETDIDNYTIIDGPDGPKMQQINPEPELTVLQQAQYAAQLNAESRLYTRKQTKSLIDRTKRGIITNVSRKSANRLKKFLARILHLGLWIDFTFPDDVMEGKTLAERRDFANDCLKKLKRHLHSLGLQEIWKKEFTKRKSGKLKGLYVPHYHIALAGLNAHQKKHWQMTCIHILAKWVDIIGSDNPKALQVACHRNSFRQIHCSRQAISYIGKYFSKTNEVEDEQGEVISIGRAWGYAKPLKDGLPDPHHLFLSKNESIQFRRFVRKYKKLKPNKKGFISVYEQIINGYSTFLFANNEVLLEFLESIGVDINQQQGIPF